MWQMVKTSVVLFLQGRLFKEPAKVMIQIVIGIVFTALVLIGLAGGGAPLVWAAVAAGFLGGALQPYLFKNLKYR